MLKQSFNTNANTGTGSSIWNQLLYVPARTGVYLIFWWKSFYKLPYCVLVLIKTSTAAFTLLDYLQTFFFFPQWPWRTFISIDFNSLLHFSEKLHLHLLLLFCFLDHTNVFSTAFPHKFYFLYLLSLLCTLKLV